MVDLVSFGQVCRVKVIVKQYNVTRLGTLQRFLAVNSGIREHISKTIGNTTEKFNDKVIYILDLVVKNIYIMHYRKI